MPKNQYLYDDNKKIRCCGFNFSQMNIFEHAWYNLTQWGFLKYSLQDTIESFLNLLESLIEFSIQLINLIFFPVTLLNTARIQIKDAKEQMKLRDNLLKGEQK